MARSLIIALNGAPISFAPEQIEKLSTYEADLVWSVFDEVAHSVYEKKESISNNDLKVNGYKLINKALLPSDVAELKRVWNEKFQPISIERSEDTLNILTDKIKEEYSVKMFSVPNDSKDYIKIILKKIFSEDNVKILEDYFGSYFSINHVLFSLASPDGNPITSFRWHKDSGPKKQTHIMVFLSSSYETGGRIEFINYEDSSKIQDDDYWNLGPEGRLHSIQDLVPDASIYAPMPVEGDAIVFNATNIYHCGKHPTQGVRYVMNIIMQPDLLPWNEVLETSDILKHPAGFYLKKHNPFYPYFIEVNNED